MKFIDSFIFNDELDMLESRLDYLYDCFDYFILVESKKTFTGKNKPLYFRENTQRFEKYKNKLMAFEYIPSDDIDYNNPWIHETEQRNFIANCLDQFNANDMVLVSDLDEIPNRRILKEATELAHNYNFVRLVQKMFFYNLNTYLKSSIWISSYVARKHIIQDNGANEIRMGRRKDGGIFDKYENGTSVGDGGWHLTYFMNPGKIGNKLESFSHTIYDTDYYKDAARIQKCIDEKRDLFDRTDHSFESIDPLTSFPEEFLNIFSKYKL